MQSALSNSVLTYSSLSELGAKHQDAPAQLVVLSLIDAGGQEYTNSLKDLSEFDSGSPIIALASTNDADLARAVIHSGAKGYIPEGLSLSFRHDQHVVG